MKAFYILKPDALKRKEVINAYQDIVQNLRFINNREQYLIDSWKDLSCLLYDPFDKNITEEEKVDIRRKMITTIKGYDYLYKDVPAIIDIFDVDTSILTLKQLEEIKKYIRYRYVLDTDQNFIKFRDLSEEMLLKKLSEIPISDLNISHLRIGYDDDLFASGYSLAHFNCIHFPEPNVKEIERDFNIIEKGKILTKKIKL